MSNGDLDVLINKNDVNNHNHINEDFNSGASDELNSSYNNQSIVESCGLNFSENVPTFIPSSSTRSVPEPQLDDQEYHPLLNTGKTPLSYHSVEPKMVKKETVVSIGGETKLTSAPTSSSGIIIGSLHPCTPMDTCDM